MLLLHDSADAAPGPPVFDDHGGGPVRYYLPERLELATGPTGERDFFLLRYADDAPGSAGGLLRMSLRFAGAPAPADGVELQRVPFEGGRFRLQVRSGPGTGTGDWHELGQTTAGVAVPGVHLSPLDAQLLQSLLSGGSQVLDVFAELTYRGLVAGLPWLVSADGSRLAGNLGALLGDGPVTIGQVVAAFLSLPDDLLFKQPLEGATGSPPGDELVRTELALRAIDLLFERVPGGHLLRPLQEQPLQLAVSLRGPRLETRTHRLSWSIGDLHDALTDPAERGRYFPVVGRVSPFARTSVYVVNELPFDPAHLRSVRVDLRYPGPTGVPAHTTVTFSAETGAVASFDVVYPAITTAFELAYRVTCTLAPVGGVGWPRAVTRAMTVTVGQVVQVNPGTSGLDVVDVEAEPGAFAKCSRVQVTLRAAGTPAPLATVELTSQRPSASVALPGVEPGSELEASRVAHPPQGVQAAPHVIGDGPVAGRLVRVQAADLEVLEPDRVTVTLDPSSATRFAYVGVQLRAARSTGEGTLLTLEPGVPRGWTLVRDSVFEPVAFAYRLNLVPVDQAGQTLPLVVTEWRQAEGTSLAIDPEPVPAVLEGRPS